MTRKMSDLMHLLHAPIKSEQELDKKQEHPSNVIPLPVEKSGAPRK